MGAVVMMDGSAGDESVARRAVAAPALPPHWRVFICITTFNRPEGLRKLLQALQELDFRQVPRPSLEVLVADNNPTTGEAAEVCHCFEGSQLGIVYVAEPRRGISFARNTAVETALAMGADWIAFIDDDEVPHPSWLDQLLWVQETWGVDVVTGPVLPKFEDGTPAWVIRGGFFNRPRFETGTLLPSARTGNLLVSTRCLSGRLPFDAEFSESGGEDTLFTTQLASEGKKIAWADDAIVKESVPRNRAKAAYLLSRAYAGGSNWARIEYMLRPQAVTKAIRVLKGVIHVLCGGLALLASVVSGQHAVVRSATRVWHGAGTIAGALGRRPRRYGVDK
jgi:succinoglycan biosynthesis protein ExoM